MATKRDNEIILSEFGKMIGIKHGLAEWIVNPKRFTGLGFSNQTLTICFDDIHFDLEFTSPDLCRTEALKLKQFILKTSK